MFALFLSLLIAGQALAVTWSPRIRLTSSGLADADALVTLGASTAIALYNDPEISRLFVRRSTDSGLDWASRRRISRRNTGAWFAQGAGRGTMVDTVWSEEQSDNDGLVSYRRSLDSGATFEPPMALTPPVADFLSAPAVGHGPGDVVAVAWHDLNADTIQVRVSTNGGASFGPTQTLATISSTWLRPPAVAVGNGVIYVAYFINDTDVRLRRSLNNGATWNPATTIANNGSMDQDIRTLSVVAVKSRAYLAFGVENATQMWIRYRRTTDKGASWSGPIDLSPPSADPSLVPVLGLKSGVLHAAYVQCGSPNCAESAVFYRRSTNGLTWSAPEKASHDGPDWAVPGGVGFAGRVIVLYTADNGGTSPYGPNSDVFVRTGTP